MLAKYLMILCVERHCREDFDVGLNRLSCVHQIQTNIERVLHSVLAYTVC